MDATPRTEAGPEPVILGFTLTAGDFAAALRARRRKTVQGRIVRVVAVLGTFTVALALSLWAAGRDGFPWQVVGTVGVPTAYLFCHPGLVGRSLAKATLRNGEVRTTVDGSGLSTVTRNSSSTMSWETFGRYVESDTAFVLLSPDRNGICLNILPKRAAAAPADVDRLRALLDTHVSRG